MTNKLLDIVERITPALRRLHLCKVVYELLRMFVPQRNTKMSFAEAEQVLQTIHRGSDASNVIPEAEAKPLEYEESGIAVIVPAYNAEDTIDDCLYSILSRQTLVRKKCCWKYSVIVVNDGSTDHTAERLQRYAGAIHVITQPNGGLSAARNAALDYLMDGQKPCPRYLMFVDADDRLDPQMIDILLQQRVEGGSVECGYRRVTRDGKIIDIQRPPHGFACGKLVDAELFHRVRFPVGYWHEDGIWTTLIAPRLTERRCISYYLGYLYTMTPGSITNSERNDARVLDIYWMCKRENDDRLLLRIPDTQEFYEECLDDVRRVGSQTWRLPECEAYIAAMMHEMNSARFAAYSAKDWRMRQIERPLRRGDLTGVVLAALLI